MAKIPKQKAVKLFEQARAHLGRDQFAEAERLLSEVAAQSDLKSPLVAVGLGDAALGQGRVDEALLLYREGLNTFPKDATLHGRVGMVLVRQGKTEEALVQFARAGLQAADDPLFCRNHGYALLLAGRVEEAEPILAKAVAKGAGPEAKLTLALARARLGHYREADEMCAKLESNPLLEIVDAAKALRAECRLFLGDASTSLELYKDLRARKRDQASQLAHMAYAAQLAGEPELCDELVAQCSGREAQAEELLLFAQIANLRNQPAQALERLAGAGGAPGPRNPGFDFVAAATQGRALRLQGKASEALQVLEQLRGLPEATNPRLGTQIHIDLGHLSAEQGDFEASARFFKHALELDPDDPEAQRGLSLTERRVAWRSELAASADAKVDAAKAETEAMRRHFAAREGEIEQLRRELERVKAAQRETDERARQVEEAARQREAAVKLGQDKRIREELALRESEIEEKAKANIARAIEGLSSCPPQILNAFVVAETTFQKALYTQLPGAAVAVLFAGALERMLFLLFVERFRQWLRQSGRLAQFLDGAVRERRGKRVEYFDHFVEAFDEDRPGRAPSMGEVGRVLQRRQELYLKPFQEFLASSHKLDDRFFDELTSFVLWAKEKLRDPIAHGHGIELGYEELKRFREQLLFSFENHGRGLLALLFA